MPDTHTLSAPIFSDEEKAREHFEALLWPDGPVCPHCGNANQIRTKWDDAAKTHIAKSKGKTQRPGLYWCFACKDSFTVTVGTVMERSHIPLHKWALAFHLMSASKKGISAHQLHRMLGVTYRSAWFMCHRIREAMRDDDPSPLGGPGKVVEADETYSGPKRRKMVRGKLQYERGTGSKRKTVSLVERGGRARSIKVEWLNVETIREILRENVHPDSTLNTDEAQHYTTTGRMFAKHETVKHVAHEYVRDGTTTNTVEGFFSIFKRGMHGVYQHCGEQHLQRYLHEYDFRYSNRIALGVNDEERAARAVKGAEGKRLTYRQTKGDEA